MGFLSGLFTSDVAEKAVDGIYNGVDMAIYTNEEKAIATQKQIETKLKLLPLFDPFRLAQRYIAIIFTVNFVLAFWIGVFIYFQGTKDALDTYIKLVEAFGLFWIMGAIITWYFTGGIINSYKKK